MTTQEPESGSWVIIDGFLGQITQEQAENMLAALFGKYEGRIEIVCIEDVGGGAVFNQLVKRMFKTIPVVGEKGGGVAKEVRWERMLAPYLGMRRILLSDAKNIPFLDSVRTALGIYPNINKRGDWAADVFDSLVWAHYHAFMQTGDPVRVRKQGPPKENPWKKLSKMK